MLYWEHRQGLRFRHSLATLLVFVSCTLLPQLPFALYNSAATGTLSGPSTAGGAVLCIGNNPESAPGGLDIPYPPTYEAWMASEKHLSIPRRILLLIYSEPGAFLELQWNKFLLFWNSLEYPNNISEYNANLSSVMRILAFLPTGLLLLLGIAGGFRGFYQRFFLRRKQFLLLWCMILLYAASVSCFYILARFRLPILPLICVSGGVFLAHFLRRMKVRRTFHFFLILLLAGAMVYFAYPAYSTVYEPGLMRWLRPDGIQSQLSFPFSFRIIQRLRADGRAAAERRDTVEKRFRFPERNGFSAELELKLPVAERFFLCSCSERISKFWIGSRLFRFVFGDPGAKDVTVTLRVREVRRTASYLTLCGIWKNVGGWRAYAV